MSGERTDLPLATETVDDTRRSDFASPAHLTSANLVPGHLLWLQRTAGNRAVTAMMEPDDNSIAGQGTNASTVLRQFLDKNVATPTNPQAAPVSQSSSEPVNSPATATGGVSAGGGAPPITAPNVGAPVSKDPSRGGSSTPPNSSQADDNTTSATPAPKAPTAEDPSSGIDWEGAWSSQDFYSRSRAVLEMTRPIPVAGLFTGLVADTLVVFQDLDMLRNEPPSVTEKIMFVRNVVNLINNAVGSLASLDIWVQDAAVASGVGAVLAPVTGGIQEALKSVKVILDVIEIYLDVGVAAAAAYNASHAATPESHDRWNNVLANYEGNLLGDALTMIFDLVDLATVGGAQGENVKLWVKAMRPLGQLVKGPIRGYIRNVVLGWIGIYGSGIMPKTDVGPSAVSAQLLAGPDMSSAVKRAAKLAGVKVVRSELAQMRALYTGVDVALTEGSSLMAQVMAAQREQLTQLLGGRDPVKLFVTMAGESLNKVNNEITALRNVQVVARTAEERSAYIRQLCATAISSLDMIQVPNFQVPKEGSDGILDAAAKLVQEQLVDRLANQARNMVDSAKNTALEPVRALQVSANDIAEFSVILQQTAGRSVDSLQARIVSMSAALTKCHSLEDIFNAMIAQAFEALGAGEAFTIADLIAAWKEIGPTLDQADALVAQIEISVAADDDTVPAGSTMATPEPPTE